MCSSIVHMYISFLLDFTGCRSEMGQFGIMWASTEYGETDTQPCPNGESKGRSDSWIFLGLPSYDSVYSRAILDFY